MLEQGSNWEGCRWERYRDYIERSTMNWGVEVVSMGIGFGGARRLFILVRFSVRARRCANDRGSGAKIGPRQASEVGRLGRAWAHWPQGGSISVQTLPVCCLSPDLSFAYLLLVCCLSVACLYLSPDCLFDACLLSVFRPSLCLSVCSSLSLQVTSYSASNTTFIYLPLPCLY